MTITLPLDVVAKEDALRRDLAREEGLVIAFSGGVDSTYLLAVGLEVLGTRCLAATAVSPSLAPSERDAAQTLARRLGARHVEVMTHEGERPGYVANGPDRCYHCKAELFDRLAPLVECYGAVAVGTIVDDLGDHRPGQLAARERGVLTPLADAGLTKADVRAASRARGLPTAAKPAQACLASRVAYGLPVTPERLARIASAESWLRVRGFHELRVRDHGEIARVEVPVDELAALVEIATELDRALRELGWRFVTIDPGGLRSGSMNDLLRGVVGGGEPGSGPDLPLLS
ncbi:MAG: ATP-dependent sacrificial sulfur transferase LarE [Actinomycetota bacterium]|nr:ATP-dependent sacrificial sulfur transferase LarE [Actinomycetota bacterium]